MCRLSAVLLVALCCAWGASFADQREPPQLYALNIPRGSLLAAIKQFSEQTGIQVTANFGSPEVQDQPVTELLGEFEARDAMRRLLAGTKLDAKWEGDSTVHVYPRDLPRSWDGMNQVTVTGTRLTWDGEGPEPVRSYDTEDIDRYGVSSLSGLAGYFTQQPYSFGEWAQRSGAQHFQMRGLGVDTTLVLINGRRVPPSATSVTLNAFDLNTIPLTAVDRVEIMSDSASAIYGADAIGGVINIILKKEIEAPDVYLQYGTAAGGAEERRMAGSIGTSGERFKASLTVDYFDRTMLVGAERDLWRNQDFRRFGGRDYRVTVTSPANVYSLTGDPLPGLTTSQASVPLGTSGMDLTPADFLTTAGLVRLGSADETRSVVPDVKRISAFGSAEFSLGTDVSIFSEVLIAQNDALSQGIMPFLSRQTVSADNPFNPFDQDVTVDYSLVGMDPTSVVTESEFKRFVVGVRGTLSDWDWEFVVTSSDERVDAARINDLNPAKVAEALSSTDRETALNPFTDGPPGSPDLLSSLVGPPQEIDAFSDGLLLSGFLRSELFRMPGGMSDFVFGGEWRQDDLKLVDMFVVEEGRRTIASAFSELKLPLWRNFWIKLALRGDYYHNESDSVNPQYGFVWRPMQNWLVRATYGTSFRPPSLLELSTDRVNFSMPVADPRRGGAVSPVTFITGGNPDLEHVAAHSFTGGVLYKPNSPGFQFGTQYWLVVMDNRIVVPRTSDLAGIEAIMPGRIVRQAPTEDDRRAGWLGALESIDVSLLNYGRLETSGIDFDVSYRLERPLGRFTTAVSATWVNEYSSEELSSTAPRDRVGVADLQGTIPEWRLVGSLMWEGDRWGISTTTTYTPRYRDADPFGLLNRGLPSRAIVDMQAWLELDRIPNLNRLQGWKLTAGALNILDEKVDFGNVGTVFGFDISQADLKQRFAYLRITKAF